MTTPPAKIIGRCRLCVARDNDVVLQHEPHDVCACTSVNDTVCWHHACALQVADKRGAISLECNRCSTVLAMEDTYAYRHVGWLVWVASGAWTLLVRILMLVVLAAGVSMLSAYAYKGVVAARHFARTHNATEALSLQFGVPDTYGYHSGWWPSSHHMALGGVMGLALLGCLIAGGVLFKLCQWSVFPIGRWLWSKVRVVCFASSRRYRPSKKRAKSMAATTATEAPSVLSR